MANGIVRIIMEAAGLGRVRAAFRGVVDEARRSDRAVEASASASARRRMLTADQLDRELRSSTRSRVTAEIAADREIDRSRERLSRADRARIREEERNARAALRARNRLSSLSTAGAVVTGVGGAIADRVSGWGSAIGIPSRDEMISRFITNEQRVIRLANAGGRSSTDLSARVAEVSRATNVDPTAIIGALEVAQNRFSRLGDFADNMEEIARAANAAGGAEALPDWVAALGEFQRQLGTSAEDVPALLGAMVDAMDAGSIEAGDVAANFAEIMGSFRNLRGEAGTGLSGAREFLALAEAAGAGGTGPEEARTRVRAMMTSLRSGRVRDRIESALGDREVFDRSGRLNISMGELVSRMADRSDVFGTPAGLERVFGRGDVRATEGWTNLVNLEMAARANPESTQRGRTVSELMEMSSERGTARINSTMAELMDSTSGRAIAARIQTETTFGENGDALVAMMTEHGGALAQLTAEYPLASEALSTMTQVVGTLTGTLATLNLAMGGGILGGGAAAAGAGGGGAAAAGGGGGLLGLMGGLLASAGTVLGAGALFSGANEETDASVSNARARRDWIASLSSENRAAFEAGVGGFGATDRRRGDFARELMTRDQTTLDPESIRSLAESMGSAVSRSLASGAPADGRSPGEPGRR